ncbi:hypothetical protein ACFQU7_01050 [Pseudoroseomonas wenyumeiae]
MLELRAGPGGRAAAGAGAPSRIWSMRAARCCGRWKGASPLTGKAGAFWMLPWTNRLDGGRFPCAGEVYHFPIAEAAGNALHGLGREAPWAVEEAGPAHAVLTQRLRHAPFDYAARLEVALDPEGLSLALRLEHRGAEPCPMGMGWHPGSCACPAARHAWPPRTAWSRTSAACRSGPSPATASRQATPAGWAPTGISRAGTARRCCNGRT